MAIELKDEFSYMVAVSCRRSLLVYICGVTYTSLWISIGTQGVNKVCVSCLISPEKAVPVWTPLFGQLAAD